MSAIRIKRSLLSAAPASLQEGELAYVFGTDTLYIGAPGNALRIIAGASHFLKIADFTAFNIGLGNVNNTSDIDKPVSTAQANAIALKLSIAQNLNDLSDKGAARSNIGLGNVPNVDATNADNISAGTLDDERLSANIPRKVGGKIVAADLPAYVDDVIEAANLAAFPASGSQGVIYVALDTNLTYRWGGSTYTEISAGAVQSVNGYTGIINLTKADVGLGNVDNTSDASKPVSTAQASALAAKLTIANNLSDLTDKAAARGNLELKTMAVQDANNVNITGGSIAGTTVIDGGTF